MGTEKIKQKQDEHQLQTHSRLNIRCNVIALRKNATVRQVFPACPGKPFASVPFGDDPFHRTTALRKPKGKVTNDTTHLYQIIKILP